MNKEGRENLDFSSALMYMRNGGVRMSRHGWQDDAYIYFTTRTEQQPEPAEDPDDPPVMVDVEVPYIAESAIGVGVHTELEWNKQMEDLVATDWFMLKEEDFE